jgi:hypothetical protein
MKKLLTIAAILAQLDTKKTFDVYSNASGMGIGGMLMQDSRSIAYAS